MTTPIAWSGLALGIVNLLWNVWTYCRRYRTHLLVVAAGEMADVPPHVTEPAILLRATNTGEQPVAIESFGLRWSRRGRVFDLWREYQDMRFDDWEYWWPRPLPDPLAWGDCAEVAISANVVANDLRPRAGGATVLLRPFWLSKTGKRSWGKAFEFDRFEREERRKQAGGARKRE